MSFRVVCPKDPTHVRFEVTASVQELWEVGPDGQFRAVIESGPDVTHRPDSQDLYTCLECNAEARVEHDTP